MPPKIVSPMQKVKIEFVWEIKAIKYYQGLAGWMDGGQLSAAIRNVQY